MAVNDLKNNGDPLPGIPWAHWIGHDGNDGQDGTSGFEEGNQQVMAFQVYWTDAYQAAQLLMGVNRIFKSPGQSNTLDRIPPARHPNYPWLRCSRLTGIKGHKWLGKADTQSQSTASYYQYAIITATFTMPKYRVLSDTELDHLFPWVGGQRQEWQRWLNFAPQIGVETLSREGKLNYSWADAPTGQPFGKAATFVSPVAQALPKGDLCPVWTRVPLYNALYSSSAASLNCPINMDACVGTLNLTPFLGRPAQTLRFNGYRIVQVESPTDPEDMNLPKGYPPLVANVELSWSYWNPPIDPMGTLLRGHNLAPYPAAVPGYWYPITADGILAHEAENPGSGIYGVTEHAQIFLLPG